VDRFAQTLEHLPALADLLRVYPSSAVGGPTSDDSDALGPGRVANPTRAVKGSSQVFAFLARSGLPQQSNGDQSKDRGRKAHRQADAREHLTGGPGDVRADQGAREERAKGHTNLLGGGPHTGERTRELIAPSHLTLRGMVGQQGEGNQLISTVGNTVKHHAAEKQGIQPAAQTYGDRAETQQNDRNRELPKLSQVKPSAGKCGNSSQAREHHQQQDPAQD
jgi:hypothetical protein